ncbi:bifunctional riboflavin kinase/FAD synthetase [Homoserinimonas sp. OAct 916]|uniref:bifunctional riboflavin kinase/FAD synthetase n=1 Tax=Homoserinimonas sp. OAct 916 TaxID=2211450 RepID=UPI000DBE4989|nr:bifunctional riboflavin kinase/FAD synthetase [Homoserinimonas sp. OAct 916]
MELFRGITQVPTDLGGTAVTIGKFDGVHAGHREVINQLEQVAAGRGLLSAVVTFDRHPLSLFAPESCPEALVGLEQKLELLASTGVDVTLLMEFTREFAALSPEQFVEEILVDCLHAGAVLVGHDFRFGAKGAGDVDVLRTLGETHGFEVHVIDDVTPTDGRRVSSTWIRSLMADGDVAGAGALLEHTPCVRGMVVHGAKRGRALGFPTANLSADLDGLIPADGVYAGWLITGDRRYPAAISVGSNPTFAGVAPRQVEAHVLDETPDLYDRVVDVCFVERIRPMVAFAGIEPLKLQMRDDVERARHILS